nr:MAG TPA: hypothetical protein [Caudoviricetes sp.]
MLTARGLRLPQLKRSFRTNSPTPFSCHALRFLSSYRKVLYLDSRTEKSYSKFAVAGKRYSFALR